MDFWVGVGISTDLLTFGSIIAEFAISDAITMDSHGSRSDAWHVARPSSKQPTKHIDPIGDDFGIRVATLHDSRRILVATMPGLGLVSLPQLVLVTSCFSKTMTFGWGSLP